MSSVLGSAETLSRLSTLSQWAAVVFAVLAALSGAVRIVVSSRLETIRRGQSQALGDQLERAANENVALRGRVEAAERSVSEARTSSNDALSAAARAGADLELTRQQLRPRSLTSHQKGILLKRLTPLGGSTVTIKCPLGDAESISYSREFEAVLKEAGWHVKALEFSTFQGQVEGLALIVHSISTAPPYAGALQDVLNGAGLTTLGVENPTYPEGSLTLLVGYKPQALPTPPP